MKGIVWYINNEAGIYKLDDITKQYKKKGINFIQYKTLPSTADRKDEYVIFENGDEWRTCYANDTSRGRCCNISLIESKIPKSIVNTIILPCTKSYPYTAYNFYSFNPEVDIT